MRPAIPEPTILAMRQRHTVMSMDEIRTVGQPTSSWGDMLFAIDDLSRQNLTRSIGNTPAICEVVCGFL